MKKINHQFAQILWDYMRLDHRLEKADVILGLGSTDTRTAKWCAGLYKDGWAPKILFSGAQGRMTRGILPDSEARVFAKAATELGVPESAVIKEEKATNTGENIRFSSNRLQELGLSPKKIILVTKPYMLRRSYATFMKQWPSDMKPDIVCSGLSESFEEYCQDPNYNLDYVVNVMVGDLQRIIEYPKLGLQIKQEVPTKVINAYQKLIEAGYTEHLLEKK